MRRRPAGDERAAYRRALRIVDQHPAATVLAPGEEAEAYLWPPNHHPRTGKL